MKKFVLLVLFLGSLSLNACNGNEPDGSGAGSNSDGVVVKLTAETFQKLVWNYKKNPKEWVFAGDQPCIIDFYADWCRPCKMVAPIMEELSKEYKGRVRIYKVNTDEEQELAGAFGIRSIPSLLFVPVTGQPKMAVGALPKEALKQAVEQELLPAVQ